MGAVRQIWCRHTSTTSNSWGNDLITINIQHPPVGVSRPGIASNVDYVHRGRPASFPIPRIGPILPAGASEDRRRGRPAVPPPERTEELIPMAAAA